MVSDDRRDLKLALATLLGVFHPIHLRECRCIGLATL